MKHGKGIAHRLSIPSRVGAPRSRSSPRIIRNAASGLCACPFRASRRHPVTRDPLLIQPSASNENLGQSTSNSSNSSACQWSAEETILAKQKMVEQSEKFGTGILEPHLHYDPAKSLHTSARHYLYQDYRYESHLGDHNSTSLGRTFGHHPHHPHHTHHGKMGTDPTIFLTLARWARIGASRFTGDDDQVDRTNYQITSLILLLLVTLTGMRQYLSHLPLQCWIPQEFSRSWEEYAEHYCWVTNTYFANLQASLPGPSERPNVVRYYQWATFMLALQAFGFILPCFIWRMLQNVSGFHVQRIMRGAMQVNSSPATSMAPTINQLGRYMDAVIYHRHYKVWRRKGLHEWCQTAPANRQTLRRVTPATQPAPSVQPSGPVKSVHFQSCSSFTLPSRKTVGAGEQESSEAGLLSLRRPKKCRAPSPPVSARIPPGKPLSSSTSAGRQTNSELDLQPLAVEEAEKMSPKPSRSFCCTRGFCPSKRVAFRTSQEKAAHEQSSGTVKRPDKPLRCGGRRVNTESERYSRRNWLHICCCLHGRQRRKSPPERPLQTLVSPPAQPSVRATCCQWKSCCKTFGTLLVNLGRPLGTLICLIPSCLCHWPSCCLGNKLLKRNQAFLFYLYVTVKLFYVLNLIGQIYFMKVFLGADSFVFGFLLMRDLVQGRVWQQSGNFPRVTYCEFEAKKLGKNYKYTLQCVLPLNLFLEKVYVFLWFWMAFLTVLTTYSLFKWLCRLSIERHRIDFVRKYVVSLKQFDDSSPESEQLLRVFANKYLEHNGLLLLWLIATNAGDVVAAELTSYLWDTFNRRLRDHGSASPATRQHSVTFNTGGLEKGFQGQANWHRQPSANQNYSTGRCGELLCRYCHDVNRLSQADLYCTVPLYSASQANSTPRYLGVTTGTASTVLIDRPVDHSLFGIDSSLDSIV